VEELLKHGYKVIGETEGIGQTHHIFLSREENGVWGYLVVEVLDYNNNIYDITGLINGKTIKVD
jgi:hypothetical protein